MVGKEKGDCMNIIYEPKGKAREYSPLAANLYNGCGHKCKYCYVPGVMRMDRSEFDNEVSYKNDVLRRLELDCAKLTKNPAQVLMSFTTDPYNPSEAEMELTRKALELFLKYKIPVAILTKGGKKCLRDLDIFKKFGKSIKVGASLTYFEDLQSKAVEADAALPGDRIETLKTLSENGIHTWVSCEPIIYPGETLKLLKKCVNFVDEFQFGLLSNEKRGTINWDEYVKAYIKIVREHYNKEIYIKKTLQDRLSVKLQKYEIDQDHLTVPLFPEDSLFG